MRFINYTRDPDYIYVSSRPYDRAILDKLMKGYLEEDIKMTRDFTNNQIGDIVHETYDRFAKKDSKIVKVIFNDPATIVFWRDNTKTVVKCDPTEQFDPEKGLAMAIAKKALGNKGNYFNEIKKWTEEYEAEHMFDNCIYAGSNLKELRDFHFSSTIDKAINQLKKDLGIKSPSEKCGSNKED